MLVLSRKLSEGIRIGDAVVKVLDIRNGRVRLGIEAPHETRIVRSELDAETADAPPVERSRGPLSQRRGIGSHAAA